MSTWLEENLGAVDSKLGAGTGTSLLQPSPALGAGMHPGGCAGGLGVFTSQITSFGVHVSGCKLVLPPLQGAPTAQG